MEMVKGQIEQLSPTARLEDLIQNVNREFSKIYQKIEFPLEKSKSGFQAVAVIYSDWHREIWLIGDCQFIIDGQWHLNAKKSDIVLAEMRSLILQIHDLKGNPRVKHEQDEGRQIILPWILESAVFANNDLTEFGYAVLNGEPIPQSLIKVFPLGAGKHEIILASDGYPTLENTLEKTEQRLREQIASDPMCYRNYLSTKGMTKHSLSFDDRTYIKFIIGEEDTYEDDDV
ncbi:hypothetical protein [Paenibacillus sanguinis]|uniref:hypothetical protein n=1 Tax=Paenibacillus sanguinis TaxID=225906 RepID=UPI00037E8261|nr:hypothetical protein [Paenibacillus sanguinis]